MNTQPITKNLLRENGFTKDETAPVGIDRWQKKTCGYTAYYVWVLIRDNVAVELFVRKTVYSPSGAVKDTRVFSAKEPDLNTLVEAQKELDICIINAN